MTSANWPAKPPKTVFCLPATSVSDVPSINVAPPPTTYRSAVGWNQSGKPFLSPWGTQLLTKLMLPTSFRTTCPRPSSGGSPPALHRRLTSPTACRATLEGPPPHAINTPTTPHITPNPNPHPCPQPPPPP